MKKIIKICVSLVLVVALLASCKPAAPTKTTDRVKQTSDSNEITFMIPDWGAPTKEMLQEFEKESGVKVQVLPTSWDDIRNKISTAAAGKSVAADVFEVDWAWIGEFHSADWIMPIELDKKDVEDIPTLSTFTVDQKIYAVPYANDFRVAYYNKELYEKAGLKEAPKTWAEVQTQAEILKQKNVSKYPVSLPLNADENATTTLIWLAFTRNGIVFNKDNTIHKESVLDALTVLNDLNKKDLINPANRSSSGMDAYRQILSGQAAFIVGPSSFVSRVNDEKTSKVIDKVNPIVLPGKDSTAKATVPYPEAIGISKFTKNPEASEKFVKWYTSKNTQKRLNEELNTTPTRTSVLKELIDANKIKNAGAMLELSKMVQSPFPNGVPKYYTKMSSEIFNAVNQMANGKLTPQQAADQITKKVNAIVKKEQ